MATSVALPTSHRSVADWPRWIVDGSATNWAIDGAAGGGGGGCSIGLGGGGGGGATFFLHPETDMNNVNPNSMTLIFLLFILDLPSYRTIKCTPIKVLFPHRSHVSPLRG
jgi:hypothetical protein